MADPVELPALSAPQEQAWHTLMDLHERIRQGWTLIGGQLVHLHCAERDVFPPWPTDDIDTVVDIRASPGMLQTFTGVLAELGFAPETSGDGVQHRWCRDLAQVDVLIPEGVGERARQRAGTGGAPTISAPGTTQALKRTEAVTVLAGGRNGAVLRPNLVAALVGKAAARTEIAANRASVRHSTDFVVLVSLISARDFRETELTKKDKRRLRAMLQTCHSDADAMAVMGATESLDRLVRGAGLQ